MDKTTIMSDIQQHAGHGYNQDIIYQPLYDSLILSDAPFVHHFLCVPIGQPKINTEMCKTSQDTNMCISAQLPLGNEFYATGIGVYFVPNAQSDPQRLNRREDIADTLCMLSHGYLEFTVGLRRYLELAPLAALPPQFPMYWARDDATLTRLFEDGPTKAQGPGIKIQKPFEMVPIYIQAQQSFLITIRMDNVFKLYNFGKLAVMLDGFLIRDTI